ncbi:excinuclease ABC subunit A [Sulfitobacter sp. D35]|uniref:excinuclease ABC subunit A n=1 Tax=Sulfitobacter sp. D35 TaxID=3083252 RepID=UPI00296F1404|nr:excinuclease ABC subunit A [Sulfitobacter sp. D35]MDW4496781.1 excinuclease ABC subunit A [Sulfitobacter sp. D35]
MRTRFTTVTCLAAALAAFSLAPTAEAAPKGCPPGLAKKAVPCVPPGQAKKAQPRVDYDGYRYGRGDVIDRDYVILANPDRYGLNPRDTYYRSGGYIYRVDEDTRKVLDLIGAVNAILN